MGVADVLVLMDMLFESNEAPDGRNVVVCVGCLAACCCASGSCLVGCGVKCCGALVLAAASVSCAPIGFCAFVWGVSVAGCGAATGA